MNHTVFAPFNPVSITFFLHIVIVLAIKTANVWRETRERREARVVVAIKRRSDINGIGKAK